MIEQFKAIIRELDWFNLVMWLLRNNVKTTIAFLRRLWLRTLTLQYLEFS
jgi:hypothetical protein